MRSSSGVAVTLVAKGGEKMDLSLWLKQELNRRGWTPTDLAQRAGLPLALVAAVMQAQPPPQFEFCCRVAQALDKQL